MQPASCAWDGARPFDRRTTQDAKKFPPLHVNPQQAIVSGQLSALIGAAYSISRSW
jgi:hypothetical protein